MSANDPASTFWMARSLGPLFEPSSVVFELLAFLVFAGSFAANHATDLQVRRSDGTNGNESVTSP